MMSQSDSVVAATQEVLGESFKSGTPVLSYITKDQVKQIVDLVTNSILEGETDFSAQARSKHDSPAKVRSYVVGMVNNWHRKSKELNGGTTYVPQNPGSRQGSSDPQLKELKLLRKALAERNASPESLEKVDEAIQTRLAEIQPAPTLKKIEINLDLIPESLRELVL